MPANPLRRHATKYLLRRAARPFLPPEIPDRPKHGFDVPVGAWLRGALKGFAEGLLFSRRASTRGIWQPEAVRRLWDRHQSGEQGLGDRLWVLVNWELWCQVVYETPAERLTAGWAGSSRAASAFAEAPAETP